jgi:hypothetical protein
LAASSVLVSASSTLGTAESASNSKSFVCFRMWILQ